MQWRPGPWFRAERVRDQAIEDMKTIVITATRTPRPMIATPHEAYRLTFAQIILEELSLVDSMRYTPQS